MRSDTWRLARPGAVLGALLLAACGSDDSTGTPGGSPNGAAGEGTGAGEATGGNSTGGSGGDVGAGGSGGTSGAGLTCVAPPLSPFCMMAPPQCAPMEVPEVVGSCWGDCVPIGSCGCSVAEDCPDTLQYTCVGSIGRCSPYL